MLIERSFLRGHGIKSPFRQADEVSVTDCSFSSTALRSFPKRRKKCISDKVIELVSEVCWDRWLVLLV